MERDAILESGLNDSDYEDTLYRGGKRSEREFAAVLAEKQPTKPLGRTPSHIEMEQLKQDTRRVALEFKAAKDKGHRLSRLDFMDSIEEIVQQRFPRIDRSMIPAETGASSASQPSTAASAANMTNTGSRSQIGKTTPAAAKGPRRITTTFVGQVAPQDTHRDETRHLLQEFFRYNEMACDNLAKAHGKLKRLSELLPVDQVCQLARMTPHDPGEHPNVDVDDFEMNDCHQRILHSLPDFFPAPRYVRSLKDPQKKLAVALATHHYRMALGLTYHVRPLADLFGVPSTTLNRYIGKDSPYKKKKQEATEQQAPLDKKSP